MPGPEATGSERRVLTLLRSVDWGGVSSRALSSLNLADHTYQRWGEIDFLLVGEKGLIAIEVKGGEASCTDGKWRYEDRLGRTVTRSKSPMVQAKDAFFSLEKNYLTPRFGRFYCANMPAGFCVIFAGMTRHELAGLIDSPEFPAALVGGSEDLASASALQKFLEGVSNYWIAKNACRTRIPERDVKALVALLRPEFEVVRPLKLSRERVEGEMLSLTEEQYAVLDHWEGADRIFCSSPAGCGKTLLVMEMLRRLASEGVDARILVGTDELAKALRLRSTLSDRIVSIEEVEATTRGSWVRSAVLLIDEGQQLLTSERLAAIDAMVVGGLSNGRWAWFGDVSYQAPGSAEEANAAASNLAAAATVRPKLTKNCRNTPEIILSTEMASGVPLGHALVSGRGLHPVMAAADEACFLDRLVAAQVAKWREEEIPLTSITVLTDGEVAESAVRAAAVIGGFAIARWNAAAERHQAVYYADIESFRGLESGFVILCLAREYPTDFELGRRLYLGMTRGNFALSVFAPASTLGRVQARMAESARVQLTGAINGQ
ncbi:NERD domain-containing protein [Stenotrophomonas maltophilia]|uniref:nuclease-related domain-containing DEAD/DEAH box helicase n=1 Tax=Stenotrophomonas maltophilia TaxID=40324 RepID=UPI001F53CBFF|nr:nuclease-related domain-containing protein [Stenotrophomonas maltophilia]MCI1130328.1 NERD domain-containing protein [Stenotrophomonas maltophilia]